MRKLLATITLALTVLVPSFAQATDSNQASYWEGQTEHPSECYKNSHGTVNGSTVTLPTFNQDWPGDHWELLVVKGGSVDTGYGPGNAVYFHPSAGVAYSTPLNNGGNIAAVSHWIVCKGTTPVVTTTTTQPPTTTTEAPPSTTISPDTTVPTTVPVSTSSPALPTTTIVDSTTTSLSPPVTTTISSTPTPTTNTVAVGTAPVPPTLTENKPPVPETTNTLPSTGNETTTGIALIALGAILLGLVGLALARRNP